jgi:hypothetical protein
MSDEDELYKKVQAAYEAWQKANEVRNRLIAVLMESGRDILTPDELVLFTLEARRITRNYKRGPSRTFLWPLGGFITKETP